MKNILSVEKWNEHPKTVGENGIDSSVSVENSEVRKIQKTVSSYFFELF